MTDCGQAGFPGEDEAVARLKADEELLSRLVTDEFGGLVYDQFVHRVCAYGVEVMMAWLQTGEIFVRCARRGWRLRPCARSMQWADYEELAYGTVAVALPRFVDALRNGEWDPARGASLKTYFIGRLPSHFTAVYRALARRMESESTEIPLEHIEDVVDELCLHPHPGDPIDKLIEYETLSEGLAALDPRTRTVVILRSAGYSYAEIADISGMPSGVVKGLIQRHQQRTRPHPDHGQEGGMHE